GGGGDRGVCEGGGWRQSGGEVARRVGGERTVEEQRGQEYGTVVPPQIPPRAALGVHEPCPPGRRRRPDPFASHPTSLDASMPHAFNRSHILKREITRPARTPYTPGGPNGRPISRPATSGAGREVPPPHGEGRAVTEKPAPQGRGGDREERQSMESVPGLGPDFVWGAATSAYQIEGAV